MVLLHALKALGFSKLIVCHLDHALRGRSSIADAAFVQKQAAKLACRVEIARADTRGFAKTSRQSLEAAARDLRLAFFHDCARRHRCPRLFLAHHADDQIETCLFNFLRGSGPAGLAGMRPTSQIGGLAILRPLLPITRGDIRAYASEKKIPFREDATNLDPAHTRNRIRHDILPAIERAIGPSYREAILRGSHIFRQEDDFLASQTPPPTETLDVRFLRQVQPAIAFRTVLAWLRTHNVPEAGYQETRRVLDLLATTPAKTSLPGNIHARRRAGRISLEPPPPQRSG